MKPVAVVALCIGVFVFGFLIGRFSVGMPGGSYDISLPEGASDQSGEASAGSATVNTANLSDGQRQMLQAFGIDADAVEITPAMIACAEAKIGAARVEEIKNGGTPSMSEGAVLLACYQGN